MNVASTVTGIGTTADAGSLTVLAWPGAAASQFDLIDEDDAPTKITVSRTTIEMSRALRPTIFRVRVGNAWREVRLPASASPVSVAL